MNGYRTSRSNAFTLIEVVTTIAVSSVVVLATISGIVFSVRAQKMAREHSLAQRKAAEIIEQARQTPFRNLTNVIDTSEADIDGDLTTRHVLIDDRQTANPDDDVLGKARLQLFREEDNGQLTEVDDAIIPATEELNETLEDYLLLKAVVTWNSRKDQREVSLITHMAPQ